MLVLNQLSMSYGEKLLFYDVNLNLLSQTKYALVGANGAGKSTLLKLITGEEEPIAGTLSYPKDAIIGWLKQDQFRYETTCLTDIVLQGKPRLWQAMREKDELLSQTEWNDKIANRLSQLEELIAHLGGYQALAFAEKLLAGLGIQPEYFQKPLNALSGGFKLRVLLAQALFQEPDVLLLDEPTNHLDIISIHWLEKYLKSEFKGLLIFISHDVEFINRLADYILDVDYGEIRQYSGYYPKFLDEKQLIEEQKLHIKKQLEDKIASMQAFIDKFKASATRAKQAQSRAKQIEKLELPDIKQSSRIAPHFHFEIQRPSGKRALSVKHLSKQFQEKKLFQNISFEISRGEKIAIIGENGIGKSTLMKMILGRVNPDEGHYEWGHETSLSYFSQDHHDLLNTSMPVLDWLTAHIQQTNDQAIRKVLGQLLFKKDDVKKDILALSGGESARLLLARIMLEKSNVLLLDEPTNHLDVESIDALADALRAYRGTLICISHDRHFMSKIANRVLSISHQKGLHDYRGDFSFFEKQYDL